MGRNRFVAIWVRLLLSRFGRWLRLDRLPVNATANDGFTRFLVHSNQFRSNGTVVPAALLPRFSNVTARWETSTHRTDGLRRDHIWVLGYMYVENLSQRRRIKARGSGMVRAVTKAGLQFEVNGRPYPRHADLINWSNDKHTRLMAATVLAEEMTVEIDPRPAS